MLRLLALAAVLLGGCGPSLAVIQARPSDAVVPADDVERGAELHRFRAADGLWGYVDADGAVRVPARFDGAAPFEGGRATVQVDGLFGAIDPDGRLVVDPVYDELGAFAGNRARVGLGPVAERRYGYVGPGGEVVVAVTLPWASVYQDDVSVVRRRVGELRGLEEVLTRLGMVEGSYGYSLIDTQGRVLNDLPFPSVTAFSEGLAAFQTSRAGDRWGYIGVDGRVAIEPTFDGPAFRFTEGLARVGRDGRLGFVDRDGRFVISPTYEAAGPFSEGLAAVAVDGRWGYVDRTGARAIAPQFTDAGEFSEGLAAVAVDGRWGYADTTGAVVIAPAYRRADPFRGGVATVYEGGRPLLIDRAGRRITPADGR